MTRDGLQKQLGDRGVHTGLHYPIPVHLQARRMADLGYAAGQFPALRGPPRARGTLAAVVPGDAADRR